MPGNLWQQIEAFFERQTIRAIMRAKNLTPVDVYFGRSETIVRQRERIKQKTIEMRRLLHRKSVA